MGVLKQFFSFFLITLLVTACSEKKENTLKVIASPVPHGDILQFVQKNLSKEGVELEIIISDDYNTPNRALAGGEVDANFFQHRPFLEAQVKDFGYKIIPFVDVHLEPLGFYSEKIQNIEELKEGAVIAIPNDPTNEGRALLLLEKAGLLTLDKKGGLQSTILNIQDNPQKLHFIEMEAAMIARSLKDVDLAAINTNYALAVDLNPLQDALLLEGKDSPYVNILVIREEDKDNPPLLLLKKELLSSSLRDFITKTYENSISPVNN